MTDTPAYDATLSDLLLQARRGVERAEAKAAQADRRAAEKAAAAQQEARAEVMRAQHVAARTVAEAHARADAAVRAERVRRALLAQEAEERVRQSLADVPPLPPLAAAQPAVQEEAIDVPPVPSMNDLLAPTASVSRFFDALLGPPDP